jgi:hypothetical protein
MARESFLLRTDPKILSALRRWAEDDLRSTTGQLDFILRRALRDAGRLPGKKTKSPKNRETSDGDQ